jgi:hypothetical protein
MLEALFGNWSWAGAEFLAVTLVITFVLSRIFLWLFLWRMKVISDRFAGILLSNGLSLVLCALVYARLPNNTSAR